MVFIDCIEANGCFEKELLEYKGNMISRGKLYGICFVAVW